MDLSYNQIAAIVILALTIAAGIDCYLTSRLRPPPLDEDQDQ